MAQTDAKAGLLARLLDVVAETLEIDPPDGSANFLDLGGDSLSAIVVAETLREEGTNLSVDDLFSAFTLEQIAAQHDGRENG